MSAGLITVGKISGHFGVKGWVKVISYTEPRNNIFSYSEWLIENENHVLTQGKPHGKQLIAKLDGFDVREHSEVLIGKNICIEKSQLPDLGAEDFYWCDLVGLEVINQHTQSLGTVTTVFATGANDVLVVKGEEEILIPYIPDMYITEVDIEAGHIVVDWEEPE
ncbi:ribosome maturation factor RimM [Marinicella sp. W31]|uniref:ribosome maturation factor RimM n=1 Tax=Marinicella sp. W31 TaxID=3023713 RepID=UPI0037564775